MTPSAIHQAVRLHKYPGEMAWLCQPTSLLPKGMTELLRLSASKEKIKLFAEKNHTDADALQATLLYFIDNVLLAEDNIDEKVLGFNKKFDPADLKQHYQLLINIYHPDKNSSPDAAHQTTRISKAYQTLKHSLEEINELKNIRISRVPPKSFYQATSQAEQQISNTKSAFLAVFAITLITAVWIGRYLYEPSSSELVAHNTITDAVVDNQSQVANSTKTVNNIAESISKVSNLEMSNPESLSSKTTDTVTVTNSATVANLNLEPEQFQRMLSGIEVAYEQGDAAIIQRLLNTPEIKRQSNREVFDKLENLFKITSDRKMLLYDFEWQNISGQISGKGKFLSRYHLNSEDQWLTREGIASISAKKSNNSISISSLKLDDKSIDQ